MPDFSPGSSHVPFPRQTPSTAWVDVDMSAEFSPFAAPQYAQSYDDVAPRSINLPSRRQSFSLHDEVETDNVAETESVNGGEINSSIGPSRGRKRKRGGVHEPTQPANTNMVELMSIFFTGMQSQIGALVAKVGAEAENCSKRQRIFDALDKLDGLTVEEKLDVSKFLAKNPEYMDIFYDLSEANKVTMVRQFLKSIEQKSP